MRAASFTALLGAILLAFYFGGGANSGVASAAPGGKKVNLGPEKQQRFCDAQFYQPPVETDPVKAAQQPAGLTDRDAVAEKVLALMGRPATFDNWRGIGQFEITKEGITVAFMPNCKESIGGPPFFEPINNRYYESFGGVARSPAWSRPMVIPLSSPEAEAIGKALKATGDANVRSLLIVASGTLVPVEADFKDMQGYLLTARPHSYYVGTTEPWLNPSLGQPGHYFAHFTKIEVDQ